MNGRRQHQAQSAAEKRKAVDLRSNFELKAQNSDDTLTLSVVIKNRATGAIVFQKFAAKFMVIAIKN